MEKSLFLSLKYSFFLKHQIPLQRSPSQRINRATSHGTVAVSPRRRGRWLPRSFVRARPTNHAHTLSLYNSPFTMKQETEEINKNGGNDHAHTGEPRGPGRSAGRRPPGPLSTGQREAARLGDPRGAERLWGVTSSDVTYFLWIFMANLCS